MAKLSERVMRDVRDRLEPVEPVSVERLREIFLDNRIPFTPGPYYDLKIVKIGKRPWLNIDAIANSPILILDLEVVSPRTVIVRQGPVYNSQKIICRPPGGDWTPMEDSYYDVLDQLRAKFQSTVTVELPYDLVRLEDESYRHIKELAALLGLTQDGGKPEIYYAPQDLEMARHLTERLSSALQRTAAVV